MFLLTIVLGSALGVIFSLSKENVYKSAAVITVPASHSSSSLSILGGSGGEGLAQLLGGSSESLNQLSLILRSSTIKKTVIDKLNLSQLFFDDEYGQKSGEMMLKRMNDIVKIADFQNNAYIQIEVITESPKLSYDIANQYLLELDFFLENKLFSKAKRERIFLESQLKKVVKDLLLAGKELSEFHGKLSISPVNSKVDIPIKDLALDFIDLSNTDIGKNNKGMGQEKITGIPEKEYLSYLVMRKESLSVLSTLLRKQYELAKINEVKETLQYDVIDYPSISQIKYGPKRALICISFFIVSVFLGIIFVFFKDLYSNSKV